MLGLLTIQWVGVAFVVAGISLFIGLNAAKKFFPDRWVPKYAAGDLLAFDPQCFSAYSNGGELFGRVQLRDKNTRERYYKVVTKQIKDHKGDPLVIYIHEDSVLYVLHE